MKTNPLEIEIALKRPFDENQLHWRKGFKGGNDLVYIDARAVMNRLDDVFGIDGWQAEYEHIGGRMICRLSCRVLGNWITKSDGAGDTDIEGDKGGISDALKRAAVLWGVGRYLYYKGAFDNGRRPAEWATPAGYDKIMEERHGKEINKWLKEYKEAA